jgi:hypothetical protein
LARKKLQEKLDKNKIKFNYAGAEVSVPVNIKKHKPSKPDLSLAKLDNQIRNLEMAVNDILVIPEKSDYFRYLA